MTDGTAAVVVIAVGATAYSFGFVSAAFGIRFGTRAADGLYRFLTRRLRAWWTVRDRARYAAADVREPPPGDFELWKGELDRVEDEDRPDAA